MLIDSHAHLDLPDFDNDRSAVIKRAQKSGIEYILTIGINLESCKKALALANAYNFIYASIGIHPHDSNQINENTYAVLKSMANNKKIIAFGEIGLDFYRNRAPKAVQIKRFREQINLATELGLPIIIHSRDAHNETLEALREEKSKNQRGVIHCFSGEYSVAKKYIEMGFSISIPGIVTFPKAIQLCEVIKKIPLSSMLIETDCPYLTPVPHRGKRNEPYFIRYIAEKVASLSNKSFEEVAEVTSQNFKNLFFP